MNPYLAIQVVGCGKNSPLGTLIKTNVVKGGGKNPIWNHRLVVHLNGYLGNLGFDQVVKVICYDRGIIKKAIEIGRLSI
jgi:hypothetical protein